MAEGKTIRILLISASNSGATTLLNKFDHLGGAYKTKNGRIITINTNVGSFELYIRDTFYSGYNYSSYDSIIFMFDWQNPRCFIDLKERFEKLNPDLENTNNKLEPIVIINKSEYRNTFVTENDVINYLRPKNIDNIYNISAINNDRNFLEPFRKIIEIVTKNKEIKII